MEALRSQVPLAPRTTLGVGGNAEWYGEARTVEDLRAFSQFAQENQLPLRVLGSGSNVLVSDHGVHAVVVRPLFSEIVYAKEDGDVLVTAGAGVVLDVLVADCVAQGLWGLENLSAIPGTVGALPIQNVGAYGVEAKDVVVSVSVYDPHLDAIIEMSNAACAFAYRDSFFKQDGKHLIITAVTFRVSRAPRPTLAYKDLAMRFGDTGTLPTLHAIRAAIIEIRCAKFPDWHSIGTAGSFFKNPIIPRVQYEALRATYPDMPGFSDGAEHIKVALGWILDHVCGLRGYMEGKVGLFEAQALVLVCARGATAEDIVAFSEKVIADVYTKTKINIEREVTLFL